MKKLFIIIGHHFEPASAHPTIDSITGQLSEMGMKGIESEVDPLVTYFRFEAADAYQNKNRRTIITFAYNGDITPGKEGIRFFEAESD